MHLVREGSVVEVRDAVLEASAETAAMEARAIQAELAVGPEDYFVINSTTGFNPRRQRTLGVLGRRRRPRRGD